ncbi:MAG TPA: hypothetical protein VFU46_13155, partial [Gemmatimonadales bacterium]|nr:hypothetical protein [Gemmatimonadales bacterium]
LRLGIAVAGDEPTGARIGQRVSTVPTTFESFVTPIVDNTQAQEVEVGVEFDTYLPNLERVLSPDLLQVGGAPSSRALIRFPFPSRLRDSAAIVRATLELTPADPVRGLPNDPGSLEVRALTADLGAKSPTDQSSVGAEPLPAGSTGVVEVDIVQLVRLWQGASGRPPALFLQIGPEAASLTEASFGSTRQGTGPRLRVEYLRAFPFERF